MTWVHGSPARWLPTSAVEVVGLDVVPPRHDLGKAEFVRADIRNPVIAKVIAARGSTLSFISRWWRRREVPADAPP